MCNNIYIKALTGYFSSQYGISITNKLLMRIFTIEKTLKINGFDTINTNEFFFLLYFSFEHIKQYIESLYNCSHNYNSIQLMRVLELAIYMTYSYFGPTVEYTFSLFVPSGRQEIEHINWKSLILELLFQTEISNKFSRISYDNSYFNNELKQFILKNVNI